MGRQVTCRQEGMGEAKARAFGMIRAGPRVPSGYIPNIDMARMHVLNNKQLRQTRYSTKTDTGATISVRCGHQWPLFFHVRQWCTEATTIAPRFLNIFMHL